MARLILKKMYTDPQYVVDQINNHGVAHLILTITIIDTQVIIFFKAENQSDENQIHCLPF